MSYTDDAIKEISRTLAVTGEKDLIEDFLKSILTPSEISEVASRWTLVKKLKAGDTQRKIASDLGLSLCKITRGSKELKKENSSFKRMIELFDNLDK